MSAAAIYGYLYYGKTMEEVMDVREVKRIKKAEADAARREQKEAQKRAKVLKKKN